MSRLCIFCHASVAEDPSEEHVTPRWLLQHLRVSTQAQFFQGVVETATNELTDKRIHATHRFVEGRICGACNNGWMSRLEESAKPTLIELIENHRGVWGIDDEKASVIAKWAVKTAYVLANVSKGNKPVQPEHIACLTRDTGLLPDLSVSSASSFLATDRTPPFKLAAGRR
jgi:hypothetical protein